jgi:cation transport regulator ChaB
MPSINEGESEDKYVSRCTPIVAKEKGIPFDEAAARCHGMWKEHKEKGTQYEMFEPPESGNAPESVKKILNAAYNSCRSEWVKDNPNDKENTGNKTSCSKQAWAAVHNAGWNKDKEGNWKKSEYETEIKSFKFEVELKEFTLQTTLEQNQGNGPIEDKDWIKFKAVAVVGDRMMKNAFVPYKVLRQTLDEWNGTIHDINHMATSYPDTSFPFKRQNIEYVIGYQDNAYANDSTKEISMDVNINKNAPKFTAWKSFVDIKNKSGKIPNVSMSIDARFKKIKVKELQFDSDSYDNAKMQGFNDDDIIEYLLEVYPRALTTCIQGDCSAKKGCGLAIKHEHESNCNCLSCNPKVIVDNKDDRLKEEKDAKYLASLNEKIKNLKGGKI